MSQLSMATASDPCSTSTRYLGETEIIGAFVWGSSFGKYVVPNIHVPFKQGGAALSDVYCPVVP